MNFQLRWGSSQKDILRSLFFLVIVFLAPASKGDILSGGELQCTDKTEVYYDDRMIKRLKQIFQEKQDLPELEITRYIVRIASCDLYYTVSLVSKALVEPRGDAVSFEPAVLIFLPRSQFIPLHKADYLIMIM